MIMLGVTITLGFAIWGYANSQVGTVIAGYGESTGQHLNQLKEDFIIVNISYDFTFDEVTVWIYNSGKVGTSIAPDQVFFGTSLGSLSSPSDFVPPGDVTITSGDIQSFTFRSSTSLQSGTTYYVKVLGQYGTASVSYQTA